MSHSVLTSLRPLSVALFGDADHAEFADATRLLNATAKIIPANDAAGADLLLFAQSRPGTMSPRAVSQLRRGAPVAGQVVLLGTWCEGETRTGRPIAGVHRVFWYEFAAWWAKQVALWNARRCPEWARDEEIVDRVPRRQAAGLIALETTCWDTSAALADTLRRAGYTTTTVPDARGIVAGIWEGRQLDGSEVERLESFCRRLRPSSAPVIALLDFPRTDRCAAARQFGVAAVVGKPWRSEILVRILGEAVEGGPSLRKTRAA